jgi:hypothetical protein
VYVESGEVGDVAPGCYSLPGVCGELDSTSIPECEEADVRGGMMNNYFVLIECGVIVELI